jgi:SpoVK/Ycf46/Vps4 family AAA+-type ATPase
MSFLNEFVLLLKARYPIIYISTSEEERLEYIIKYCTKKYVNRTYYSWDFVDGYKGNPNDNGFAAKNPLEALELVEKLTPETASVFVLKDYDNFLKDLSIIRKLKNLSRILKTQPKNIIIISSEINIPDSLREIITLIDFPLPTYQEIEEELLRLTTSLKQNVSKDLLLNLTTACQGLSLERIRRVLSKVIAKSGTFDTASPTLVLEEKKQIIQQTQLLEFTLNNKQLNEVGGLDNFKDWLTVRSTAFLPEAKEYGLPYPKGVLLVGVQGTGKSLAAKTVANEWKLPLLRLDFGRLFASLIGQSESRVRKMIAQAEALSPCVLWVDEIDKAFAGAQSSGDSGTTSRVLATFLTWLGEKTSPVFVVSTANNIEWIPPEILRKGRFDEVFFLALPTKEEREAIFNVHLNKARPNRLKEFNLSLLSDISKDFSGAEIEQVVIDAMRLGFSKNKEFEMEELVISTQKLVPLARTKNKELRLLKEWFESGNVVGASKYT